ncbi:uncharacterized protein BXZ73DRAFT_97816 [Epithele typhae]|uniref:uncharacterized protein n=1 Tax=Epithele typhae TaxID=378194 RepID=UPI002008D519|nr:uncharacterized protein BXZ73DRAFT_97816 [Epithele typhae]KAH9942404.1 hypothetical protein BXZ73DRAFT_97816 [Epithele typhae]
MPLPQNASLPLQGVPVQQSKPKHAMLFRMSAETFDALEDLPKVEFKFGDNPGLYIGDSFFPVQQSKESLPHELYLRVASQGKPMVPLKLCANVVGKMKVDAQLSDEIRQRVRERQVEAEAFRKGRSRPMDKVIQMCAGDMPQAEIKSVIHAVAEHDPDGSESLPLWRLKINSWREVRPWDYPKLTDAERQRLATQARSLFKDLLKVPDTDPVWDHGTKKTTKADTARSRVSDIVVPAKDESKKGKARAVDRDLDEGELSSVGTPTSVRPGGRRQPGSGYRAKPSATPPATRTACTVRTSQAATAHCAPICGWIPRQLCGRRCGADPEAKCSWDAPSIEDERPSASSKVSPRFAPATQLPTFKKNKRLQDEIADSESERETPLKGGIARARLFSAARVRRSVAAAPARGYEADNVVERKEHRALRLARGLHPPPERVVQAAAELADIHVLVRRWRGRRRRRRGRRPLLPAATANSSASSDGAPPRAKPVKSFARFTPRRPFPCNSPDLRKYWRVCHAAYTALCERHQLLRDTAARLLADINAGRSGEETVMDVDPESLMPEVAHAFAEELKTVEDELNKIRDAWRRLGGGLTDGRELC